MLKCITKDKLKIENILFYNKYTFLHNLKMTLNHLKKISYLKYT